MADLVKLIDYFEIRKLFDEEYKRKMQLVREGEMHLDNMAVGFMGADDVISRLPNVDAVEVVRCKDCIRCGFCGEATNLEVMGFDGYCSRGKRREKC